MTKYVGTVQEVILSKGSKSERAAIVLVLDEDTIVEMRQREANPFEVNEDLQTLVGKRIQLEATDIREGIAFVDSYEEIK